MSEITGFEILDSRGNPTVAAEVKLADGAMGFAAAPSGASTGSREALELRDGDPKRYRGKGVLHAVANINGEIRRALVRMRRERPGRHRPANDRARRNADEIAARRERHTGGVACRGEGGGSVGPGRSVVSPMSREGRRRSCCPFPMMNIINGGAHADNSVDLQEFMIIPAGASHSPKPCDGASRYSTH